ncbi:hypothetical protein TgHK011_004452 [Trichoderma gracile]|nr:hypothetical protein TgHK011_004452 [Trichoderma gracile]
MRWMSQEELPVLKNREPTEVHGYFGRCALPVISGTRAHSLYRHGLGCPFSTLSGLACHKGPPSRAAGAPCGAPCPTMEP